MKVMKGFSAARLLLALAAGTGLLLICSCGDMESILPASRNYQMSARGDNFSFDEYALVKKEEKIRPFFVYPLKGDPDAAAIEISVKSPETVRADWRIRYVLEPAIKKEYTEETGMEPETLIHVEHFNGLLPPFNLPQDLGLGPYILIFQVFDKKNILLSKTEKCIYYMADEDYELPDIKVYLPAIYIPSHLIPPGTVVMLEAGINAGPDLDPYIFWYNGKNCIYEGKVSEGADRFLWKAPLQTGFHNIRAEVVPFPPPKEFDPPVMESLRSDRVHRGKTRELSLPVSDKGELRGGLTDSVYTDSMYKEQENVLWNFQLAGTLNSRNSDPEKQKTLARKSGRDNDDNDGNIEDTEVIIADPGWNAHRGVYGLKTGPLDIYRLPFNFPPVMDPQSNQETRIIFALRFISMNEGTLFSLMFNSGSLNLSLVREDESFVFILNYNEMEERRPAGLLLKDDFYALLLDFTFIDENIFLSVKEDGGEIPLLTENITLRIPPDSPGLLQLGEEESAADTGPGKTVMILGELSVLFSGTPAAEETEAASVIQEAY